MKIRTNSAIGLVLTAAKPPGSPLIADAAEPAPPGPRRATANAAHIKGAAPGASGLPEIWSPKRSHASIRAPNPDTVVDGTAAAFDGAAAEITGGSTSGTKAQGTDILEAPSPVAPTESAMCDDQPLSPASTADNASAENKAAVLLDVLLDPPAFGDAEAPVSPRAMIEPDKPPADPADELDRLEPAEEPREARPSRPA